jgi:VanZ family protein
VILLWAPVVVYMAAIFYGASMSQVPGPVGSWFSDTFLHAGGYAGLALLTIRALAQGRWPGVTMATLAAAFVVSLVHGAAVEWMQMYVPTRMAEWRDLGNDAVGALVALVAVWAWGIMKAASRAKSHS